MIHDKSRHARIAIVILNYRTPEMTVTCLASAVKEICLERDLIVVVDNDSGDDSISRLESAIQENGWQRNVILHCSATNSGFAGGNNQGIKAVDAEAYLFLNSDATLEPGCLATLYQELTDHPKVALAGPRIMNSAGEHQASCFRKHHPLGELIKSARTGPITQLLASYDVNLAKQQPSPFDWISFATVMIRAEAIAQVGLLDEGYFMYYEDSDYCRTLVQSGWTIHHVPEATVIHNEGGSSMIAKKARERKNLPAYYYASRSRYFTKWYGKSGLLLANLCWLLGRGIDFLRCTFGKKTPWHAKGSWKQIWIRTS